MMINTRYIAYGKQGVFGPFASQSAAENYAFGCLTNGHVRPLKTPKPQPDTKPKFTA